MRAGPITNLALFSLWVFTREFLRDNTMHDAFVRWESELMAKENITTGGTPQFAHSLLRLVVRSETIGEWNVLLLCYVDADDI
jgi:hypothetical protein